MAISEDRTFKDRLKKREARVFNANKLIEHSDEQDHLNLNRFFTKWIRIIKNNDEKFMECIVKSPVEDLANPLIQIEDAYDGPRIDCEKFNENDLHTMLKDFRDGKLIHSKYVLQILIKANEIMKQLPNVNELTILGTNARVNIVGDIHGQFMDLYTILDRHGLPTHNNIYVFNGDFVDRGPQQIEVYIVLLYMLVLYQAQKCVFLNRGNHEDYGCSIRFGFKQEIMSKYCVYSKKIMAKLMQSFVLLPLCTIVTYPSVVLGAFMKAFIVHGGITDETDLNVIRSLDREKFDILDGTVFDLYDSEKKKAEREQIQDLLWSDPMTSNGCSFNKQRCIAKQFGPDVTHKFLKKYNFNLIIRSHECKFSGYEFAHDNHCLTVFSASNYCGGVNKGAICILRPKRDIDLSQFVANESDAIERCEHVEMLEEKIARNLKRLVYFNRVTLLDEFSKLDLERTGYVSLQNWIDTLNRVLNIENVSWKKYRLRLAECDDLKNLVKYSSSFTNCNVTKTYTDNCKSINDALARYKDTLVALFKLMDVNHSGSIDLQEFARACKVIFHDQNEPIGDDAISKL